MNIAPKNVNPNTSGWIRETQTYRCCGLLYRRWRFVGHHFHPNTVGKECCRCNKPIPWENLRYHRRAKASRENGLTAHGKPRVRVYFTGDPKARARQKFRKLTERRQKVGLTSRGTKPVYRQRISQQELAWRDLRDTMNIKVPHWDEKQREEVEPRL